MSDNVNGECKAIGNMSSPREPAACVDTTNGKIVGIYGLRCRTTSKWYIGQSKDIIKRWNRAYKLLNCKRQIKIYNALKKYGYDDFETVVIETCDDVDWILDYREMYWIRHLNSIANGYNLKEGGRHGTHSKETREKLRKANLGKHHTEETKQKLREIRAQQVFTTEMREKAASKLRGRKMSVEFCKNASERALKREAFRKQSGYYTTVTQSDKQTAFHKSQIGHVVSAETRRKISEAQIGKKLPPEQIERIRKMNTGRVPSLETRKKLSITSKGRKMPESAKEKIRQWNLGRKKSPETCQKISDTKRLKKSTGPTQPNLHHVIRSSL